MSVFDLPVAYPLFGVALFIVSVIFLAYIRMYGVRNTSLWVLRTTALLCCCAITYFGALTAFFQLDMNAVKPPASTVIGALMVVIGVGCMIWYTVSERYWLEKLLARDYSDDPDYVSPRDRAREIVTNKSHERTRGGSSAEKA